MSQLQELSLSVFKRLYQNAVSPSHQNATIDKVNKLIRDSISPPPEKGSLIMGSVGTGKTSLMAIILRNYLIDIEYRLKSLVDSGKAIIDYDSGYVHVLATVDRPDGWQHIASYASFWYGTQAQLVQTLRNYYMEGEEIQSVGFPPSLIKDRIFIDDFGRAYSDQAGWNTYLQEEYIDFLWREKIPTYLTTNWTWADMQQCRSGLKYPTWQRVADRLCDSAWIGKIEIVGKSLRQ
ncbi:MAG: hypothetical protein WC365_08250 [Candidatus Babeliales bacterium]|jgi:DNA replication protein DnaC